MEKNMLSKIYYKNAEYRYYLIQLLGKFTNSMRKEDIKQIYSMIKQNDSDSDILGFILAHRPIRDKAMNSK